MIPLYLSLKEEVPPDGYWDQEFIKDLLKGIPETDRQVIIIPGAYQWDVIDQINARLSKFDKVMVFITSDEEKKFDRSKLSHKDMIVWNQYHIGDNMLPLGYTPHTRPELKKLGPVTKDQDFFFSGQITHTRRQLMADAVKGSIKEFLNGTFISSTGFSQGIPTNQYIYGLAKARVAPAPPGPISHDSFRLYEALEAGCVPIVDEVNARGERNYWNLLFHKQPFPVISSYDNLAKVVKENQSQAMQNKVFAWWIKRKFDLRQQISRQLGAPKDLTSIIVPTSPIPSHPSPGIIEATIKSIRHHFTSPIYITIDGVRPEQEHMREKYEEYIRLLLWKCNFEWENVVPILFEKHVHQSGMMREVLKEIKTPLLMYVEHDTPLVTDEEIEWDLISGTLLDSTANVIRFHYEAVIPEAHKYLMLKPLGDKFLATKQWSQRPHIARTDFYKSLMQYFSSESNCFIEDKIYTHCVDGDPWEWKVFIYTPNRDNIKRSLNLDGRAGDRKFEAEQQW